MGRLAPGPLVEGSYASAVTTALVRITPPPTAHTDRGVGVGVGVGVGSTFAAVRAAYKGSTISQAGTVLLVKGSTWWVGFNDLDGNGLIDGVTLATTKNLAAGFEVCSGLRRPGGRPAAAVNFVAPGSLGTLTHLLNIVRRRLRGLSRDNA